MYFEALNIIRQLKIQSPNFQVPFLSSDVFIPKRDSYANFLTLPNARKSLHARFICKSNTFIQDIWHQAWQDDAAALNTMEHLAIIAEIFAHSRAKISQLLMPHDTSSDDKIVGEYRIVQSSPLLLYIPSVDPSQLRTVFMDTFSYLSTPGSVCERNLFILFNLVLKKKTTAPFNPSNIYALTFSNRPSRDRSFPNAQRTKQPM